MEITGLTALEQRLGRLEPRERKLLGTVLGVLLLALAWSIVHRVSVRLESFRDDAENGGQRLTQVEATLANYDAKRRRLEDLEPKAGDKSGGSLEQIIQEIASQSGAADLVATIRNRPAAPGDSSYRESAVEMQLKAVGLEPLVKLLVGIDHAPALRLKVSKLRLDARGDPGKRLFDVSVTVSRFEKAG